MLKLILAAALALPAAALAATPQQEAFFAQLAALCGTSFEGASVFPRDPADAFAGKLLVATVAQCGADEIRIPFVVGADRSRTWIIRKSAAGLSLHHDHRHADGTPDAVTMYGGMAVAQGSASAQSFAADAHTAKLIPGAVTNVWTLTLAPAAPHLTYYLERDAKPRFKAELVRRP